MFITGFILKKVRGYENICTPQYLTLSRTHAVAVIYKLIVTSGACLVCSLNKPSHVTDLQPIKLIIREALQQKNDLPTNTRK